MNTCWKWNSIFTKKIIFTEDSNSVFWNKILDAVMRSELDNGTGTTNIRGLHNLNYIQLYKERQMVKCNILFS